MYVIRSLLDWSITRTVVKKQEQVPTYAHTLMNTHTQAHVYIRAQAEAGADRLSSFLAPRKKMVILKVLKANITMCVCEQNYVLFALGSQWWHYILSGILEFISKTSYRNKS